MTEPQIFFGTGAGRCGTMLLANLLNNENDFLCCHEGKIRELEESGKQWLEFLTLENLIAYQHPENADEIFRSKRKMIERIASDKGLKGIGDVAYNNAPFTRIIPSVFPNAKLIVIVRDGRDFVRSVYTSERPDPTPVGWLDINTDLTELERFIEFGRLRPFDAFDEGSWWQDATPVEKNAWLWAETYRLIFDGIDLSWNRKNIHIIKFEEFITDIPGQYAEVRSFLDIDGPMPAEVKKLFEKPVNRRARDARILPEWRMWTDEDKAFFLRHAEGMMTRLGYAF